jgi:hypothetical protein
MKLHSPCNVISVATTQRGPREAYLAVGDGGPSYDDDGVGRVSENSSTAMQLSMKKSLRLLVGDDDGLATDDAVRMLIPIAPLVFTTFGGDQGDDAARWAMTIAVKDDESVTAPVVSTHSNEFQSLINWGPQRELSGHSRMFLQKLPEGENDNISRFRLVVAVEDEGRVSYKPLVITPCRAKRASEGYEEDDADDGCRDLDSRLSRAGLVLLGKLGVGSPRCSRATARCARRELRLCVRRDEGASDVRVGDEPLITIDQIEEEVEEVEEVEETEERRGAIQTTRHVASRDLGTSEPSNSTHTRTWINNKWTGAACLVVIFAVVFGVWWRRGAHRRGAHVEVSE